jgi:hypothetical protein
MNEHESTINRHMVSDVEISVTKALKDFDERMNNIGGCSDGGCVIVRPKGMHTNGGCRCTRDYVKMQQFTFATKRLCEKLRTFYE